MPTIILKKTFASRSGFAISNDKSFSLHGASINEHIIQVVNQRMSSIKYVTAASKPVFKIDKNHHYHAPINHDCQKNNEEDIVAAIIDAMEELGWTFKFQYDASVKSDQMKIGGSTETNRELYLFQK